MPLQANPKAREEWPPLPPMTPLAVEVSETPKLDKGSKFGNDQLKVLFEVFEGEHSQITVEDPVTHLPKQVRGKVMAYFGLTMSPTTGGAKSMLRQFVEAIYGSLTDDEAYALDLEELKGRRVVMVGNYANPNAEQLRLKPIGFSRYGVASASAVAPVVATAPVVTPPAAAPVAGGFLQISPDGLHGWDGTAWQPIAPVAVVPPPPPAVAVVPPPPPAVAVVPPPPPAVATPPASAVPPPPPPAATPPAATKPKVNF